MPDEPIVPGRKPSTPGFTTSWHKRGGWRIVHRGKHIYLGRDTKKAEEKFRKIAANLNAGRDPDAEVATIADACVSYIESQMARIEIGEITERGASRDKDSIRIFIRHIDPNTPLDALKAEDLETVRNKIISEYAAQTSMGILRVIRRVLKRAYTKGLVDKPIRFDNELRGPGHRIHAEERIAKGRDYFLPEEINGLIDGNRPHWAAMVALGYFAGFGPKDCATLTFDEIDLDTGFLEKRRSKTYIARRAWLPPFVVALLRAYIDVRKEPTDPAESDFVFIGHRRQAYASVRDGLVKSVGYMIQQRGYTNPLTFYSLRRSCATYGSEVGDERAIRLVMGHSDPSMTGRYVKAIGDDRLLQIGKHLEAKLGRSS